MFYSYENMYYVKNLYMSAGRIQRDHIYSIYKKLVHQNKIIDFLTLKNTADSTIMLNDIFGGRAQFAFEYFFKMHKNTKNMFIIKDDLSALGRIIGVYCEKENIFMVCDSSGHNLEKFYYRTEEKHKSQLEIASDYFYRSGEYCQCNNDMI